jgi:predicted nucleotidyltransferase
MLRTDRSEPLSPPPDIAGLLFGAYRHQVLSLLLLHPRESYHVREIARLTGIPAGSLHRELRLLAGAGLLRRERAGNQVRYRANRESPVFEDLAGMLSKTAQSPAAASTVERNDGAPAVRKRALAEICRRYGVRKMSLFGSAARGELLPKSDVDLLVEFKPSSRTTSFELVHLQDELAPLFGGRRVQLAEPGILKNPHRRRAILRDLRTLYEA